MPYCQLPASSPSMKTRSNCATGMCVLPGAGNQCPGSLTLTQNVCVDTSAPAPAFYVASGGSGARAASGRRLATYCEASRYSCASNRLGQWSISRLAIAVGGATPAIRGRGYACQLTASENTWATLGENMCV